MKTTLTVLGLATILVLTVAGSVFAQPPGYAAEPGFKPGYTDTPLIPGSTWRVHDRDRPQPTYVTPGMGDLGATAPSDAVVLFDGKNLDKWVRTDGRPIAGGINDGILNIQQSGQLRTKDEFGDFQLHVEWRTPAIKEGFEQGNQGNSGVVLMGTIEIQIIESYAVYNYADGCAGAVYGQFPPLVNPSRKPLEWQSFDMFFTAPKFEGQTLKSQAIITLLFNGVLVQNQQHILGPIRHRDVPGEYPVMEKGPLVLQYHNSPVEFRNIWIRPLTEKP